MFFFLPFTWNHEGTKNIISGASTILLGKAWYYVADLFTYLIYSLGCATGVGVFLLAGFFSFTTFSGLDFFIGVGVGGTIF